MGGIREYIKENTDEIIKRMDEEINKISSKEWVQLSKKYGLSSARRTNVFKKHTEKPSLEFIYDVSMALRKPVDYFLYGKENISDKIIEIPHIETNLSETNTLIYKEKNTCLLDFKCIKKIIENPFNLVCMKSESDSMQTTIMKENQVLIDKEMKKIKEGNIYAFTYKKDRLIQIKRFSFKYDKIIIVSDNKAYEPYLVEKKDLNIIGLINCTFQVLI